MNVLKKILMVVIIILFIGVGIHPAFAVEDKTSSSDNENPINVNREIYENTNCFIVGRATHTGFIIPAEHGQGDVILRFPFPLWIDNKSISFGYKYSLDGQPWEKYPSNGWIWTKGSNGVKTWDSNSLWGNLGKKAFIFETWFGPFFEDYLLYIGVKGFTGLRIGVLSNCIFIGIASHVNIGNEFPG